ncbi:SH3 domain-containing protein [Actinacidiphila glaucinigra]|uniref:SH3 domain-containing protein n=1 Tax=Actinacidiphila glaucinigra TaxID=235986 RepID=UPI003250FC53
MSENKEKSRRAVLASGVAVLTGAALPVLGGAGDAAAAPSSAAGDLIYYPVAPDVRLNVRTGPGSNYHIAKVLPYGAKVPIICQTPGTTESGYYGTSNIWDCIGTNQYVSDTYVYTGHDGYFASRCG